MVDFFNEHTHCTRFGELTSASVIQGSAVGPASFTVSAADLTAAMHCRNLLSKYADDTYLVVPATNIDSHALQLDNVESWAKANNLALNRFKTVEMLITDGKRKRPTSVDRSVIIARLLYASSAWCRFTLSSDQQAVAAFIHRGVCFCHLFPLFVTCAVKLHHVSF